MLIYPATRWFYLPAFKGSQGWQGTAGEGGLGCERRVRAPRWMCQDSSLLGAAHSSLQCWCWIYSAFPSFLSSLLLELTSPPALSDTLLPPSPLSVPSLTLPQSRDCNLGRLTTPLPQILLRLLQSDPGAVDARIDNHSWDCISKTKPAK